MRPICNILKKTRPDEPFNRGYYALKKSYNLLVNFNRDHLMTAGISGPVIVPATRLRIHVYAMLGGTNASHLASNGASRVVPSSE